MTVAALRRALALMIIFQSGTALAQVSGGASIVSDYRVRGVSLSHGRPVVQVNLAYDSPLGWYGGAFASGATLRGVGNTEQLLSYAGFSRRINSALSWDAGVNNANFRGAEKFNYAEAFAGLTAERISGRIAYTPNYFGKGVHSLYAQINGNYLLTDTLRLTGHAGLVHLSQPHSLPAATPAYRADASVGLSLDIEAWKLDLAWLATQRKRPSYLYEDGGSQRTLTISGSFRF